MNFITYKQLVDDSKSFARRLPRIDAVVGIPRSGLLPATIISEELNIKLGTITRNGVDFLDGGIRDVGGSIDTVMVVDDSYDTGDTFDRVRSRIKQFSMAFNVVYGAIYSTTDQISCEKIIHQPRMFEWNFMNHGLLEKSCVDIDGVLCADPLSEEIDYGPRYEHFLKFAKQIRFPKFVIGTIVTGRIEKYRNLTENWLEEKRIKYNKLIMMPDHGEHADFKADYYKKSDALVFIESSSHQANIIRKQTGRSVICIEEL